MMSNRSISWGFDTLKKQHDFEDFFQDGLKPLGLDLCQTCENLMAVSLDFLTSLTFLTR